MENIEELDEFYRSNEQKVLSDPEIQDQLKNLFQAKDPTIRKILGLGSEDKRGNYFINIFNQRHGDWAKSVRVPFSIKYPSPQKQEPKPNPISKESLLWFQGSKIVDEQGNPKVVYHGTEEKFDRFEAGEFGFHFGDKDAADMFSSDPDRYLLKIKNPIRLKDLGTWEPKRVLDAVVEELRMPRNKVAQILRDTEKLRKGMAQDLEQDEDIVTNRKAYYKWAEPARKFIKSLGYDGIVYRNEAEGFADGYIAFDPDQILRIS